MFWLYVGGVLALVLIAAWLHDRRRKAPLGGIRAPRSDDGVQRGKADVQTRDLGNTFGTGPGTGL
jgi:hypothetical protein